MPIRLAGLVCRAVGTVSDGVSGQPEMGNVDVFLISGCFFGGYWASRQAFMALLMNSEAPGPYFLSLTSIYTGLVR